MRSAHGPAAGHWYGNPHFPRIAPSPAPWTASGATVRDADGQPVALGYAEAQRELLEVAPADFLPPDLPDGYDGGMNTAASNALLMAAAPELLAALTDLVAAYGALLRDLDPNAGADYPELDRAAAAISRATGEVTRV